MRLSSLQIKGFKSFADETVVHFRENVIGVVGPNGSGKSNIVDSIRWVLGEQKGKELRLDKMANVIFNGTKSRKEGQVAQVSMTFDNTRNILPTEYQQVTITRILYRSGESEYRLNNVPCRLKDINNLLLDSGIGPDSYAIIALGMIEDILHDKDDARRRMFEQVAGVSKFKQRKRETLLKLESTEADLNRVEDLLFEIKGNLDILEKQAKRTQKYFEIKAQYKEASVQLSAIKLKDYRKALVELKHQVQVQEDELVQLDARYATLEADVEQEKQNNLEKEVHLSDQQRKLNELIALIRNEEEKKNLANQKSRYLLQNNEQLMQQIQSNSQKVEFLESELDRLRTAWEQEQMREEEIREQLQVAEQELEEIRNRHSLMKADVDGVLKEQVDLERALLEWEKQKAIALNQVQNMHQQQQKFELQLNQYREEIQGLQHQAGEVRLKLEEKQRYVAELEQKELDYTRSIQAATEKLELLRKKHGEIHRILDARRNELDLTKSMVENLEGYPESIQYLEKNKQWSRNATLLSDVFYCPDEYRVGIENFLEPWLNYFVARNYLEAKSAIESLQQAQKGKANFFILDQLLPESAAPASHPEGWIPATQIVEVHETYQPLMQYLFRNVFVVDRSLTPDQMQQLDPGMTVIKKDGTAIYNRRTISGGSVGLFEGKRIGRKINLEKLEKEIARLHHQSEGVEREIAAESESLQKLRLDLNAIAVKEERKLLNDLGGKMIFFETRQQSAHQLLQDTETNLASLLDKESGVRESLANIELEIHACKTRLDQVQTDVSDKDESFQRVNTELSRSSAHFNEKKIELIHQQNKVTSLVQELNFKENQQQELRVLIQQQQHNLAEQEQEVRSLNTQVASLEELLLGYYRQRDAQMAELSQFEQAYFTERNKITGLENELKKLHTKRNESQQLANHLRQTYNDTRNEISLYGERLKIEFGISVEELEPVETAYSEEEISAMDEKVRRLKTRIDNFGEINPLALEAYEEIKARYDGIQQQKEDILSAKASLLETIQEIHDKATSQFMETFELVRTNFIDVFRTLFSAEDECDLVLLDPENPLDSNINIIAKPKGKRPLSIHQLSGGEKTLTAIALLFSLYLLKPAPFCVFDEVDAPLDDFNIEKFNRIIHKFSSNSQFIIVTHNKATMAAMDTIYGVFMEDQGVSRVAQVDFREFEHEAMFELAG